MYTLYGIKNCDTVKKAQKYLDANNIPWQFHDYRADGLEADLLQSFIDKLGWEALLNTRGTTWRKLSEETRSAVNNAATARQVMLEQPAMIKRPLLLRADGAALLGFNETTYSSFTVEKS